MNKKKWYKNKWQDKADVVVANTKEVLQLVYDSLNQGQQKQIVKNENVKALLEHHKII